MSPTRQRLRLLAPLVLLSVVTYLLNNTMLGSPWAMEVPVAPDEAAPGLKTAIPVSDILGLIAVSVNASIDRFDAVQAQAQLNYKLERTYPDVYEYRLRQIHREFFDTDDAILSTMLGHLSRLPGRAEPIAKNIFMTGAEERDGIPEECESWTRLNPDWKPRYLSDPQIEDWLKIAFPRTDKGQAGVIREMKALRGKRGIIRSDLFRYLALLLEGGVYSDTDTTCIRPIADWGRDPDVRYAHPVEALLPELLRTASPISDSHPDTIATSAPSLVVAVEMDAWGTDWDWRGYKFVRGIQIVQWTIMGSKGHPVFLDVLGQALRQAKAIRETEERGDTVTEPRVLDWSGPGAFSDALLRYLLVRQGVHPTDLAGMNKPRRYGDVMILPMHAFRAEASDQDKGDGRVVFHGFYGRWKGEEDWA